MQLLPRCKSCTEESRENTAYRAVQVYLHFSQQVLPVYLPGLLIPISENFCLIANATRGVGLNSLRKKAHTNLL